MIKIENLKKYYGTFKGIEDVSLSVKEGDIFGFVGPNGSGKSTTIRVIMGLIFATSGYVEVMGESTVDGLTHARYDIGYLAGEANFYKNLKVLEFLQYCAKLKGRGQENIVPLASRLSLDLNKKISALSLGNKKKVGIINAVMHKPKLIILDEPTSGLDPVISYNFFELLRELNKNGSTILFSSHILSDVQNLCSKVAVIKDGIIVANGTVREICGNNLKEVKLSFDGALPNLVENKSIKNINISNQTVAFDYSGRADELLALITKLKPIDVNINNAELERVIMHHYL